MISHSQMIGKGAVLLWICVICPALSANGESGCTTETRETALCQKLVKIHLEVGDRLLAQKKYYEAYKDYQQALELDVLNVDAHRKLISLYLTVFPGGIDPKGAYKSEEYLRLVYRLYSIKPDLLNDPNILMAEARILADDRLPDSNQNWEGAEQILTRLLELRPDDTVALVRLGELRTGLNRSPKEGQSGLALIRKAVELRPEKMEYKLQLGKALVNLEQGAEAIRWYRQLVQNAPRVEMGEDQNYLSFAKHGMALFHHYAVRDKERGILTKTLDMPIDERIETIEYLITLEPEEISESKYFWWSNITKGTALNPRKWLALLYIEQGQFEQADRSLSDSKQRKLKSINRELYELWIEVLERGGHDKNKLEQIIAEYEEKFGRRARKPRY